MLIDYLATTDALSEVFSDRAVLQAMLDFEAALAAAEARLGIIPQRAADVIRAVARAERFDAEAIAREGRSHATASIPLVRALTVYVTEKDPDSARFVHWGATSQDVADTALVLLLKRAEPILARDHERLETAVRKLSDRHANTVMLGRTLLQPAPPITFGLKAAGWAAALASGWGRVRQSFAESHVIQFGGASGTLAALGDRGLDVAQALAGELDLDTPPAPWHTNPDRLSALVAACGIYTGTLGKIAGDIALLMQDEVGEASEPGGGSSAMPHKRNPAGCAVAIAAAARVPGLVAAFLTGMAQEHERGAGGWQAEWPTLAATVQSTGAALASLADAVGGLDIYPERMRQNIERTNGAIFAERVIALAAPKAGKDPAQALVAAALSRSRESGKSFREALMSSPDASRMLTAEELNTIDVPEQYLGSAEILRQRLLAWKPER
jgi:3-carboxy-cis,cis-muconate cycloisomerase